MSNSKLVYKFVNSDKEKSLTVIIEPWAEEYVVERSQELRIEVEFIDGPGPLGIDWSDGMVSLWFWRSCTCQIFLDELEITSKSLKLPSP